MDRGHLPPEKTASIAHRRPSLTWLRRNVRLQLTAWYGAALIVLLLVLGLFVYWLLSTNLRHDAEAQLSTRASQIASTLNSDGESINFQDTQVPGELTLIYSTKGLLLEGAGGGQGAQSYRPSSLPSWANPGAHRSVFNTLGLTGGRWLIYAMPFPSGEQSTDSVGVGWLLVGRSLEPIYGMLNQTLYALALAGPLVILLACVGGYFMAGRALAPVAAITRTARRIQAEGLGRGNVSSIGMEGRHDELGELASTLDAMFARLEETFVRERRFTSDAAHELRTPLAVVQAETSLALARPRPVDEYKRALNVVEGESARMGKLVADLLTLARADEGQYQLSHEPVDFSSLCRGVVCQLSKLASDKRVSLTAEVQEGVSVVGDSMWLTQMLHNLVDNAIKYTEVGGWVKLRLARSAAADAVEVSVEDNGIGISAEQLPHIFDRFYRADKSRGRDNESPGLGLGLAICEWIAKAHDGRIDVRSTLGQGSCFQVSLPGMRGKG